ncbi:MAG: RNA methyltransferase [Sphingobacteriaceae bacterium]|jgi:tRNA G18 (ribose-2'-O)-methylase SpoU
MKKLKLEELGRMDVAAFKAASKTPIIIVLDNIRSMNNIGSVFRSADAFAVEAIYLCGITAQPPHREIEKTALGATDSVQWKYFENTIAAIEDLKAKAYHICAIEQVANSVSLAQLTIDKELKYALIFGNEVMGVDQQAINQSDICIEIPQFGTKHSFNIAVTAGIVLWECYRQLHK